MFYYQRHRTETAIIRPLVSKYDMQGFKELHTFSKIQTKAQHPKGYCAFALNYRKH